LRERKRIKREREKKSKKKIEKKLSIHFSNSIFALLPLLERPDFNLEGTRAIFSIVIMPRLARPKRATAALNGDDDDFSRSIDAIEEAFESMPSSSSHPLDAAVEALRSLPTFRVMTGGSQPPFASLSWPFKGGDGRKVTKEVKEKESSVRGGGALSPAAFASASTSTSSNSPSSSLPAIPDDLLKKASALEMKTTTTPFAPSSSPSTSEAAPKASKTEEGGGEEDKQKESTSFSLWPLRLPSSLPSLPSLPLLVSLSTPGGDPDKGRLLSVADFFDHARANSKKLWKELDGDGDGWVTETDVARALAVRGLPTAYAPRVLSAARGSARWWATRVSRREFASWMERGEPRALRAFTSMSLDRSGKVDVKGIKDVLKRSGVVSRTEWSFCCWEGGRRGKKENEREKEKKLEKNPEKKNAKNLFSGRDRRRRQGGPPRPPLRRGRRGLLRAVPLVRGAAASDDDDRRQGFFCCRGSCCRSEEERQQQFRRRR